MGAFHFASCRHSLPKITGLYAPLFALGYIVDAETPRTEAERPTGPRGKENCNA